MRRLTYEMTLAELTSFEEMLRSMMEDGQIHQDVINKLWEVYSECLDCPCAAAQAHFRAGREKPLPKAQRRGAIIIIGMLALAKRSVVTDQVDTMLRVGLGKFGKVRFDKL
jgi:condensin complex subunit 1